MYNRDEYYQMTETNTADSNYTRNTYSEYSNNGQAYTYGNTVRRYESAPDFDDEDCSDVQRRIRENRRKEHYYEERARKLRLRKLEQSKGINLGACTMLIAALVVMLCLCVDYVKLNAEITQMSKTVVEKENSYNALRAKNDSFLKEVDASIDSLKMRDIAINDLGMVFANKNQVIAYEGSESAYVRQYEDLPEEYADNLFDDALDVIK